MGEKLNLSAAEALYLAERMEARAVQLYERARVVFSLGALGILLSDLAREERGHQSEFALLLQKEAPVAPERAMLLDAQAGNMLFEGGLTGAVREGAFDSPLSLLNWAADEEERAAKRYAEFAQAAGEEAREAFLHIAAQETVHLQRLKEQIALLAGRKDV